MKGVHERLKVWDGVEGCVSRGYKKCGVSNKKLKQEASAAVLDFGSHALVQRIYPVRGEVKVQAEKIGGAEWRKALRVQEPHVKVM